LVVATLLCEILFIMPSLDLFACISICSLHHL
jgi:hypothetical protein